MTELINTETKTVESMDIKSWSITMKTKHGLMKNVFALGNDIAQVEADCLRYHQCVEIVNATSYKTESTGNYATPHDGLPSHWKANDETGLTYPESIYEKALQWAEGFDYFCLAHNSAISAGTFDSSASLTVYQLLGFHAHTQAIFNAIVKSGKTVFDFRASTIK